jgi:hypothetical protein
MSKRSAAVLGSIDTAMSVPSCVPVAEHDHGGIADPELALHVAPEQ